MDRAARLELARRRIIRILRTHHVALARTLEQKISDAGPTNMRVDPHVLTQARNTLAQQGVVIPFVSNKENWFHLHDTPESVVRQRLAQLEPVLKAIHQHDFSLRIGQALEIAVFRSLCSQTRLHFLGAFPDLASHDDSRVYSKEEPPGSLSGRCLQGKKRLDFIVVERNGGIAAGVEVKNVREWLYPDRIEIRDLLLKCTQLDIVPVLIGRRIPFVTFRLLNPCGVLLHQTYNQLYPQAERELAAKARDKNLLGYHDIRVGNQPDARLLRFVGENLASVIMGARGRYDEYKDLLHGYACGQLSYRVFAHRVIQRQRGLSETLEMIEPEAEEEDFLE